MKYVEKKYPECEIVNEHWFRLPNRTEIELKPYRHAYVKVNGETVATSEVYASKAACLRGAQSVAKHAPAAPCADLTEGGKAANPQFQLYQDRAGEYRFRLTARNGKIVAASEGYHTKAACEHGIQSVRKNAEAATFEEA